MMKSEKIYVSISQQNQVFSVSSTLATAGNNNNFFLNIQVCHISKYSMKIRYSLSYGKRKISKISATETDLLK